jgi:hypothetical protein
MGLFCPIENVDKASVCDRTIQNILPYPRAAAFDPVDNVLAASLCKPVYHIPANGLRTGVYGKARADFFAINPAKFFYPALVCRKGVIQENNVIEGTAPSDVP